MNIHQKSTNGNVPDGNVPDAFQPHFPMCLHMYSLNLADILQIIYLAQTNIAEQKKKDIVICSCCIVTHGNVPDFAFS